MWRFVPRLRRVATVQSRSGVQLDGFHSLRRPGCVARFCSDAAAAPRPQRPRPAKGSQIGFGSVSAACLVAGGVGYCVSDGVREEMDKVFNSIGEAFEDFNDTSREWLENIGDKIVPRKTEPWLLDLATMKYPDYIPTLVLDLDRVILRLEHDHQKGWRVIKRPYADQFFREIQHYYEIVIFSDDVFPVALDIIQNWNVPVTGVLHRDFCKKKKNHYIKDLSKLGRNMDKVLMIDHDPMAYSLTPENGIEIRPFEGDPTDSELVDLLDFLKAAATSNQDLRSFVEKYGGGDKDIGRRFLVAKAEKDKQVASRRKFGSAFVQSQPTNFNNQRSGLGRL